MLPLNHPYISKPLGQFIHLLVYYDQLLSLLDNCGVSLDSQLALGGLLGLVIVQTLVFLAPDVVGDETKWDGWYISETGPWRGMWILD